MGRTDWKIRLKHLLEDPLIRESAVLSMGTALGQVAPLLSLPILGRLYTTTDFGVYALFISSVNISSQVSCLKYDMAIPVSGEGEAGGLFWLSLLCSLGLGALLLLPLPFLGDVVGQLGGGLLWAWLVPPATVLTGLHAALTNCNLKLGDVRAISSATVVRSLTMVLFQFLLYPLHLGGTALVLGQLGSYLAGNLRLLQGARPLIQKRTKLKELRFLAGKHRDFPKYTLSGSVAGSMVFNLTSYLLAGFYSTEQLGYYSMVNRILFTPLTLLAGAVGQVFFKQAAVLREQGEAGIIFGRATGYLTLFSLPLFGGLFLLAEPLVLLLFGESWRPAALYMRLLIPLAASRFIVSPISSTPIVYGKNRTSMCWQFGLLLLALTPALLTLRFSITIEWYLGLLSLLLTVGYLLLYRISFGLVRDIHQTRKGGP